MVRVSAKNREKHFGTFSWSEIGFLDRALVSYGKIQRKTPFLSRALTRIRLAIEENTFLVGLCLGLGKNRENIFCGRALVRIRAKLE